MRIDAYNQIGQFYQSKQKTRAQETKGVQAQDQLYISSTAKDYQIAKQAVAAAPDIREDKVAAIKAQIENGTYEVSSESFAAKLLELSEKSL